MTKLAFIFFQNPDLLWVRILQAKYFRPSRDGLQLSNLKSQSAIWKGIARSWSLMTLGSRVGIRDGQDTNFWSDRWIDSGLRLIDLADRPDMIEDTEARVCEFGTDDGGWDMEKLSRSLPAAAVAQIAAIAPPAATRGEDTWAWGEESNGIFSIRSAYDLITNAGNLISVVDWKAIWSWKGPQQIRQFLWLAMHEKLLTNKERKRRHLTDNPNCVRCGGEESISHVLRDCPYAALVWGELKLPPSDVNWWVSDIQTWLLNIIKHESSLLLGVTCWYLWKARNELTFEDTMMSAPSLARKSCSWAAAMISALEHMGRSDLVSTSKRKVNIAWDHGPSGWMVLNTDGSVIVPSGSSVGGGLVRDEWSRCRLAFSSNVGTCSITRAELRGIATGLGLAWEAGFKNIVVQADSRAAISLIYAEGPPSHQHGGEIFTIHKLMLRDWEVTIRHVYREGTRSAGFLASLGHKLPLGIHRIPISDCNLGYFLRLDCMGIPEPRSIIVTT
ncbi:Putative ribonuclease H protein At1g65750 [Linum perenne]